MLERDFLQEWKTKMVDNDDPKDDEDEVPVYDPFEEFGFAEDDFENLMVHNLLDDLSFPEIPSIPLPLNDTPFVHDNSLSISGSNINNEFNRQPLVNDNNSLMIMGHSNDDLNGIVNNNVTGVNGNDNGTYNNVGEITRLEVSSRVPGDNNGLNFETGGPSTVPVLPPIIEGVFQCTCCVLLREIQHNNGYEVHTLRIYGGIGFVCHAILESRSLANSMGSRWQTYDLKYFSMEDVKTFIEKYCSQREEERLRLERNTNAAFYQAMNANSIYNPLGTLTISSPNDVPMSLVMPDEALNVPPLSQQVELRDEPTTSLANERRRKTPLAAQRERTGKMTLKDLSIHFHLPIEEAAKKMNLCPTVLKKICRKGGLRRWPHRKIKSIQKKMNSLKSLLETEKDSETKSNIEARLESLQKEIDRICSEALRNAM